MGTIVGWNKLVACEPPVARAPETTAISHGEKRWNTITSRAKLVPLNVVFGNGELMAGDRVYVLHANAAGLKPVEVEVGGKVIEVVLVSLEIVQLAEAVAER